MFALFKEVRKPEKRKKRKLNHGGAVEEDGSGSESEVEEELERMPMPGQQQVEREQREKARQEKGASPEPAPGSPRAIESQDTDAMDETQDEGRIAPER